MRTIRDKYKQTINGTISRLLTFNHLIKVLLTRFSHSADHYKYLLASIVVRMRKLTRGKRQTTKRTRRIIQINYSTRISRQLQPHDFFMSNRSASKWNS